MRRMRVSLYHLINQEFGIDSEATLTVIIASMRTLSFETKSCSRYFQLNAAAELNLPVSLKSPH